MQNESLPGYQLIAEAVAFAGGWYSGSKKDKLHLNAIEVFHNTLHYKFSF